MRTKGERKARSQAKTNRTSRRDLPQEKKERYRGGSLVAFPHPHSKMRKRKNDSVSSSSFSMTLVLLSLLFSSLLSSATAFHHQTNPLLRRPELLRELSDTLQPELTVLILPDFEQGINDETQVSQRAQMGGQLPWSEKEISFQGLKIHPPP